MEEAAYSYGGAAKILDIAESKLRYWAQVGFVGPSGRRGGKPVFSFQDLVSVKAAKELVDRGFKAAEIRKAIDGVRSALPHLDRPLDRMRVAFDGTPGGRGRGAFEPTGQRCSTSASPSRQRSATPRTSPRRRARRRALPSAQAGQGDPWGRSRRRGATTGSSRGRARGADDARAATCYRGRSRARSGLAAARCEPGRPRLPRRRRTAARDAFGRRWPSSRSARGASNLANRCWRPATWAGGRGFRRVLQSDPEFADPFNLAVALEHLGGRPGAYTSALPGSRTHDLQLGRPGARPHDRLA